MTMYVCVRVCADECCLVFVFQIATNHHFYIMENFLLIKIHRNICYKKPLEIDSFPGKISDFPRNEIKTPENGDNHY